MVTGVPVVPIRVTQVIVTGGLLYPVAVVRTANVGKTQSIESLKDSRKVVGPRVRLPYDSAKRERVRVVHCGY